MSTVDTERAIDRMVAAYKAHGENGGAYLLIALAALAGHSSETLTFLLDYADDVAREWAPAEVAL